MGVPQFIMTGFIGLLMVLILARKEDKYKAVTLMLMPTIMMFLGHSDLAELIFHRQGYALILPLVLPLHKHTPPFRHVQMLYMHIYIYYIYISNVKLYIGMVTNSGALCYYREYCRLNYQ